MRHRGAHLLLSIAFAAASLLAAPVARVLPASTANAAGSFADSHFREESVFGGLTGSIAVRFAADGRAFVAEKRGIVKAFDSISDTTPTTVLNLSTEVMDYWDRGLLGIILDPQFLGARPYLYLSYVYDGPQGTTAPVWGDTCPTPPNPTTDGCVAYSKLVRFTINTTTNVAVPGSRVDLISDWCTQFPSHSGGAMAFGDDGQLYLTGGDGASFNVADYGQRGGTLPNPTNPVTPFNPCSDPVTNTAPAGQTPVVTVATAEGGSLRSQDLRTTADPTSLDGSVIRINPDTGAGSAGNPLAGSSDANARRIVAYGFRNPFRMTKDPATGDLYIGDVGNVRWEEINRLVEPGQNASVKNFGWPCYEGGVDTSYQPASFKANPWDTLGNDLCDDLYAEGAGAVEKPVYGYFHAGANHFCGISQSSSASITGLAFYDRSEADQNAYPARYDGALFFVDYSRDCLGMLRPGANGRPDPTTWEVVATNIGHPVDLVTGPHGDLYYADLDGSRIVRIKYLPSPVARATVTPPIFLAPQTVTLDASASTDPDVLATLTSWEWDLDHDGTFNGPADKSGKVVQWLVQNPAVYPITLRVTSSNGLTDTLELSVNANNHPPEADIDTPTTALHWSVNDVVPFSGSGTDADDGALPASALTWRLILHHCSESDCHEHTVETFPGVASGSFTAPDHEYPSHLELRLTATDSGGATATASVQLDPATTTLGVASTPTGVKVDVGSEVKTSPSQTTMIRGHTTTIAAPAVWTTGGNRYRFSSWSDGLGRAHEVTVTDPASRTASYVPDVSDACTSAKPVSANAWTRERASGNGDVDWFRFSLTSRRRVVVTLGELPVNARLDLYSGCSTQLAASNVAGTRFERLTRSLAAGTYRVRVTVPSDAASTSAYALRVFVAGSGSAAIESKTIRYGGGTVRIAGAVINGTGRTIGRVAITATFKDARGRVVGTLAGSSFANRLGDGAVSPFVVSGRVPAFVTVSYALSPRAAGPVRSLSLHALTLTGGAGGTTIETGKVRNDGSATATSVGAARTWYGRRGEVLDVGIDGVAPSTLARGAVGTFRIVRPALSGVQLAVTTLRAR